MRIGEIIINETTADDSPRKISVFAGHNKGLALCDYSDGVKIRVCKYPIDLVENEIGFKRAGFIPDYFQRIASYHDELVLQYVKDPFKDGRSVICDVSEE